MLSNVLGFWWNSASDVLSVTCDNRSKNNFWNLVIFVNNRLDEIEIIHESNFLKQSLENENLVDVGWLQSNVDTEHETDLENVESGTVVIHVPRNLKIFLI